MKWISIKDKMPERRVGVLITDGQIVTCAEWDGDWWGSHGFSGYEWEFDFDERFVTHWMPLPKPPQLKSG